ncbi:MULTISPECIES: L-fuculokinase [unclassified Rhodococcus (in: high G+C Gram-positive bacteria)]|uniref:FGGY-family carbohydrate kinase n=1 Tax=unclassified Rhodococcus (in: high G+C Gram-positive bacteria) TaxID=192944 RepID=UPI001C3C7595|nr:MULTISPECIES: FGGY family carbohydrate kinase [unclassified Rhodococcus (in: high G+C Gram-positive bacteria)]
MNPRLVAGLDLGSTGIKVLVIDEAGTELLIEQSPTPWHHGPGGTTDLEAEDLLATIANLLDAVARRLPEVTGDPASRIDAIAVSGMGETGFLLGKDNVVRAPAFAWFDPRGQQQVDSLPQDLRDRFAGKTGLPVGVQVSVVKIAHLRDNGLNLAELRWFNLPEFVVLALGGRAVADYSLSSRTGLLDQNTGEPWTEMLTHLGVGAEFIPPLVDAGTDLGVATGHALPDAIVGARLTVAGHDHLVSAVSGGAIPNDRYHVSMGTAEVLLRVLDAPLTTAARSRLADHLINSVRHVVPGQHVLVAGVKTGLLMRRALQMCDITDRAGRDLLDQRVCALPAAGPSTDGGIEIAGARNDDGVLSITVRTDGVNSAELFRSILLHGNEEIARLIAALDAEVAPARTTLLTGGWAGMASVRDARAQVLPDVSVSTRSQDTAYGAALFAARLLTLIEI